MQRKELDWKFGWRATVETVKGGASIHLFGHVVAECFNIEIEIKLNLLFLF